MMGVGRGPHGCLVLDQVPGVVPSVCCGDMYNDTTSGASLIPKDKSQDVP